MLAIMRLRIANEEPPEIPEEPFFSLRSLEVALTLTYTMSDQEFLACTVVKVGCHACRQLDN